MRVLLSVFMLLVAASLQSVIGVPLARFHLSVDFLLVCVVCCSLLAPEGPVILLSLVAGIFKDSFSSGIFGHSVAVFIPISLAISRMRYFLWAGHWTTQAGLAFAATLFAWLLYVLFQWIKGLPPDPAAGHALKQALLNACTAPLFFRVWRTVLK